MGQANRTHTPAFKAQLALATIKGDQTISQVAAHYRLPVNLVAHWKKQLLEGAATVFIKESKATPPPGVSGLRCRLTTCGRRETFRERLSRFVAWLRGQR